MSVFWQICWLICALSVTKWFLEVTLFFMAAAVKHILLFLEKRVSDKWRAKLTRARLTLGQRLADDWFPIL